MAWSVLQSAKGSATAVATLTVAYTTANVSAGNKLISHFSGAMAATGAVTSVKDGAGNTETAAANFTGATGGSYDGGLFFMDTPAGDVGTKPSITVLTPNTGDLNLLVQEVSGLATGNTTALALDGTAATSQITPSSSQAQPAYTSGASGELLYSVLGDNGNSVTWTVPSGYTADSNNINGSSLSDLLVSWKNSTGGAESGTWTATGTPTGSGLIVVAFLLASGGASGPALAVPQQARARFRQRRSTRQLARQQPWSLSMNVAAQIVNLTTAQVNISAPSPSLQEQLALPVAQVNIAAPAPSPRVQLSLPVAQVNINALAPTVQVRESLSVAQVNINALAPTIQTRPSLTTAQVNINALAPSVRASVNLPVAQVNINALPLSIGANVNVSLTTAQVNVNARAPSLQDSLTLARAQVSVAALAPSPRVQLTLTTAQVSVNARAPSLQASVSLSVAQATVTAPVPSSRLSLTLAVAQATVAALAVTVGIGNAQPLGPGTGGTATGPQSGGTTTGPQSGGSVSAGISGGNATSPSSGGTIT